MVPLPRLLAHLTAHKVTTAIFVHRQTIWFDFFVICLDFRKISVDRKNSLPWILVYSSFLFDSSNNFSILWSIVVCIENYVLLCVQNFQSELFRSRFQCSKIQSHSSKSTYLHWLRIFSPSLTGFSSSSLRKYCAIFFSRCYKILFDFQSNSPSSIWFNIILSS